MMGRKHKTFLKIRLPKIQKNDSEVDQEVVDNFNWVLSQLNKVDPKGLLYPWVDRPGLNPIKAPFNITSKDLMATYVDKIWIEKGSHAYIRIIMAHDAKSDIFADESLTQALRTKGATCYVDNIQAHSTICIGWLLGAYVKTFHSQEYLQSLKDHEEINKMDVDIRIQNFKLHTHEKYPENHKVVMIFTSKQNKIKVKKALNNIYGSKNTGGLPLGKQLRFIPYTANFESSTATFTLKQKVLKAFFLQKKFSMYMRSFESDKIVGLDYFIAHGINATLREVLMTMKESDWETKLFTSVDSRWNGNVAFTYHQDLASEVNAIAPFIHIILQEKYGPRAADWFSDQANQETEGLRWDPEAGMI